MSKGILIIDGIPDGLFLDKISAKYELVNYPDGHMRYIGSRGKRKLRRLPEKKDIYAEPVQIIFIDGKAVDAYSLGWNDCLDAIVGGKQ